MPKRIHLQAALFSAHTVISITRRRKALARKKKLDTRFRFSIAHFRISISFYHQNKIKMVLKSKAKLISIAVLFSLSLLFCFYVFGHLEPQKSPDSLENRKLTSISALSSPTVHVLIVFSKAGENKATQNRFNQTTTSLLQKSSLPVVFHVVTDNSTKLVANQILKSQAQKNFRVEFYDMDILAKKITKRLGTELLQYFRFSPNSYYGDALFFLSLVTADLFPHLTRVIKIDSDLLFRADIAELWSTFDRFSPTQEFGFAREQQPVYRHVFSVYRASMVNSSTKVGDPPPDGITGFNSGVILMDLEKIRSPTSPFRSLIRLENIKRLVDKYRFQGHLGDQDLYTLLSIENPELFYTLPCQWNRQLCQWWREHGYEDVFDRYFQCPGPIKIYHGNCQTSFPKVDGEDV